MINTVLQWLTIVKLVKLFINKIISIKETNSNSLGLVSRDQPPFLSTLCIEPFGWTPSNSPNIFGVTWFYFILSIKHQFFSVQSCWCYFSFSFTLSLCNIFWKLGRTFWPFIAAAKLFSWLQRFKINHFSSWSNFSSISLVTSSLFRCFYFFLVTQLFYAINQLLFVFSLDLYYVLTCFKFTLALFEKSLFLFAEQLMKFIWHFNTIDTKVSTIIFGVEQLDMFTCWKFWCILIQYIDCCGFGHMNTPFYDFSEFI